MDFFSATKDPAVLDGHITTPAGHPNASKSPLGSTENVDAFAEAINARYSRTTTTLIPLSPNHSPTGSLPNAIHPPPPSVSSLSLPSPAPSNPVPPPLLIMPAAARPHLPTTTTTSMPPPAPAPAAFTLTLPPRMGLARLPAPGAGTPGNIPALSSAPPLSLSLPRTSSTPSHPQSTSTAADPASPTTTPSSVPPASGPAPGVATSAPPSAAGAGQASTFTPVPPTALPALLDDPTTLILDIRPHNAFALARLPSALSLSVPSTLLKRPLFSLARLAQMLSSPAARARFSAYASFARVLVYDADSSALSEGGNLVGLMRKLRKEGYGGEVCWVKGGFHAVWRERMDLVVRDPPSEDEDEGEASENGSGGGQNMFGPPTMTGRGMALMNESSAASSVLRTKHLPMAAFTSSSTTSSRAYLRLPSSQVPLSMPMPGQLSLTAMGLGTIPATPMGTRGDPFSHLPPPVPNTHDARTPGVAMAFNPFFDTIRQNLELGLSTVAGGSPRSILPSLSRNGRGRGEGEGEEGAGEEGVVIALKLPRSVRRRIGELPFEWLREIARGSARVSDEELSGEGDVAEDSASTGGSVSASPGESGSAEGEGGDGDGGMGGSMSASASDEGEAGKPVDDAAMETESSLPPPSTSVLSTSVSKSGTGSGSGSGLGSGARPSTSPPTSISLAPPSKTSSGSGSKASASASTPPDSSSASASAPASKASTPPKSSSPSASVSNVHPSSSSAGSGEKEREQQQDVQMSDDPSLASAPIPIPILIPSSHRRHSHPHPHAHSHKHENTGEDLARALAMQFYKIELGEQRRLMGVMEHHSKESTMVPVSVPALQKSTEEGREGKEGEERLFPFSITAGVEKGEKNRYRYIWPFEHARVRLRKTRPEDDDYMNASYVQPLCTTKRYIATQGPLPATFADFWTLCWEQNVHVIVMLTREVESALVKCGNYWSDSTYGTLRLRLLSTSDTPERERRRRERETNSGFFGAAAAKPAHEEENDDDEEEEDVIRRVFELTNTAYPHAPPRTVTQLQYLAWPDLDVPRDPKGLLGLMQDVEELVERARGEGERVWGEGPLHLAHRASRASSEEGSEEGGGDPSELRPIKGKTTVQTPTGEQDEVDPVTGVATHAARDPPVLLHCSAGVGRTGGFIAVDAVLDGIRREIRKRGEGRVPLVREGSASEGRLSSGEGEGEGDDAMEVDSRSSGRSSPKAEDSLGMPMKIEDPVPVPVATGLTVTMNVGRNEVHVPVAGFARQTTIPRHLGSAKARSTTAASVAVMPMDVDVDEGAEADRSRSASVAPDHHRQRTTTTSPPATTASKSKTHTSAKAIIKPSPELVNEVRRVQLHRFGAPGSASGVGVGVGAGAGATMQPYAFAHPHSGVSDTTSSSGGADGASGPTSGSGSGFSTHPGGSTAVSSMPSSKAQSTTSLTMVARAAGLTLDTDTETDTDGGEVGNGKSVVSAGLTEKKEPTTRLDAWRTNIPLASVVGAGSGSTTKVTGTGSPASSSSARASPPTSQGQEPTRAFDYTQPRPLHDDASPPLLSTYEEPIRRVIEDMREQRMSLCQSLRQYVFVHRAIIEGALMIVDAEKERESSSGSASSGDEASSGSGSGSGGRGGGAGGRKGRGTTTSGGEHSPEFHTRASGGGSGPGPDRASRSSDRDDLNVDADAGITTTHVQAWKGAGVGDAPPLKTAGLDLGHAATGKLVQSPSPTLASAFVLKDIKDRESIAKVRPHTASHHSHSSVATTSSGGLGDVVGGKMTEDLPVSPRQKRQASPTELVHESPSGDPRLSKRPSVKRKQRESSDEDSEGGVGGGGVGMVLGVPAHPHQRSHSGHPHSHSHPGPW